MPSSSGSFLSRVTAPVRKHGNRSIAFIVTVALLAIGGTLAAGNAPFLGLDLQGGVSVTLQASGDVSDESLDDAIAIIRTRIDTTGVAEPEISRQGKTIVVEIPGVDNPEDAIDLVGRTGELRFRPVLEQLGPSAEGLAALSGAVPGPVVPDTGSDTSLPAEPDGADPAGEPSSTASTASSTVTTAPADGESEEGYGYHLGENAAAAQEAPVETVPETVPPADEVPFTDEPPADADDVDLSQLDPATLAQLGQSTGGDVPTTAPEDDDPAVEVVLPMYQEVDGQRFEVGRYRLGPVYSEGENWLTGQALEGATSQVDNLGRWIVSPIFKGGAAGIDLFNGVAAQCYSKSATCPTGLLAITMDGEVLSAPEIQTPTFARDQIQISGSFTQRDAKDLATVLRYGALPVELEQQQVQVVSASLGKDALSAGVVSGLVGLGAVAIYMILFYRLLGVVAVVKLGLEGLLLWSFLSYLGATQGLALTLAGVTGIVVSIGVSVDSNVVYYEHLKEDVRGGRAIRTVAERGFQEVWSTIFKANFASIIAAFILYFLAVGPVRGFAFNLGFATVLDLTVGWFFMRPMVQKLLRSDLATENPLLFGMPWPDDEPGRPAPAGTTVGAAASGEGS